MRVIEADDVESARPSVSPGTNVILRIDEKTRRAVGEVRRSNGGNDGPARADEHAAALRGRCLARMCDHVVAHGTRKDHKVSTIIAMPIPPPMHSAATP